MNHSFIAMINDRYAELIYAFFCLCFAYLLIKVFKNKNKMQIRRWKQALNLDQHLALFETLYAEVNGFYLSKQARSRQDALEYIYGEIDFLSFIALLSLTKPNANTVFYDLGSGVGKAVIACALVYPVKKSIGIELLPELHHSAKQCAQRLRQVRQALNIQFILNDFLEQNLEEATLIFINATTIIGPSWEKLCQHLNRLSKEPIIITTSKPLVSLVFTPKIKTIVQMSWGPVAAYIHYKTLL